jgi:hypothetical protein
VNDTDGSQSAKVGQQQAQVGGFGKGWQRSDCATQNVRLKRAVDDVGVPCI